MCAGNTPHRKLMDTQYITSINHTSHPFRANILKKTIPNTIPNTIPKCRKQAKNRKNNVIVCYSRKRGTSTIHRCHSTFHYRLLPKTDFRLIYAQLRKLHIYLQAAYRQRKSLGYRSYPRLK